MAKSDSKLIHLDPALDGETYIKARGVSPGLDIYALEDAWKEWVSKVSFIL